MQWSSFIYIYTAVDSAYNKRYTALNPFYITIHLIIFIRNKPAYLCGSQVCCSFE